jgi:hypothetical protein
VQLSEQKVSIPQAAIGIVVAAGLAWFFFFGGFEQKVAGDMQTIHNQVAADAVRQYEIAKRNGSPIDTCVQAGLVVASYLQAKDEANYARWKQTETAECAAAGVPR